MSARYRGEEALGVLEPEVEVHGPLGLSAYDGRRARVETARRTWYPFSYPPERTSAHLG